MDYQKITMLDNLPEPTDNNHPQSSIKVGRYNGYEMLPPAEADRFKKFIRDEHEVPIESGMINKSTAPIVNYNYDEEFNRNIHHNPSNMREIYDPKEPTIIKKKKKYNCGKISTHVEQCQFCKKLYSSDKNLYILFIIFLFFICFLLFKKILSV